MAVHWLSERYASKDMTDLFSLERRAQTWRRVWVALAKAEKACGLPIRDEQITEMEAHIDDVNLAEVAEVERETRHDVMAHIKVFARQCPAAAPIIHLGATSALVTDNADLILFREALQLVAGRLRAAMEAWSELALRESTTPAVSYTHFQVAQLTTVGRRVALWLHDLAMDADDILLELDRMPALGAKGATGTQASFMDLFEGDHDKVRQLDSLFAEALGFRSTLPVSGQVYTRKADVTLMNLLAGLGVSLHKMGTDLRLWQHKGEVSEPFGAAQVGSSAMPYKRNPMLAERMTSLSRLLIEMPGTMMHTAATNWLERSLDDSAIRRVSIPDAFMAAEATLTIAARLGAGLTVHHETMARHVAQQIPFLAIESILMRATKAGGDRQALHEVLRDYAMTAHRAVEAGQPNSLLRALIADNPSGIGGFVEEDPNPKAFYGRAPEQTRELIQDVVQPLVSRLPQMGGGEDRGV